MDAECECGHVYDEHEGNGPCAAYVEAGFSGSVDDQPCPCVHFEAVAGSATPTCPVRGDHMLRSTQEACPACTPGAGSATPTQENDDG